MKKSFTFFAISALFLMLLFPVSLKAETIISFAIPNSGWTWGNQTDDCAGNFTDKNVVNQGAFVWSGGHDEAVKRIDDTWTGVNSGSKCCTRNTVHFNASTYTITLITQRRSDNVTMTLPTITIQQGTPSTHYAATAKWDKDGVLQTEDVSSSHQFFYTEASDKKSRDKEVTLTYTNVEINSAGNYQISINFPSGDKEKYQMKSLTITPNCTQHTVTVAADDNNKGTVAGGGSYCESSEVTVTATPNDNYSFTGWSSVSGVDLTGHLNDNPLTFTMPDNAVSITANFAACTKHTVTLAANNNEYGSVSGGGEQCDGSVTVTATPESGYRFVNWTNTSTSEVVSTDAEYTFTLSADISLTANFEVNPCTDTKLVEAEDYIDGYSAYRFPNGSPQIESDASLSNGKYFNFNGDNDKNGEINFYVYLPAATYSVEIKHKNGTDKYLNIYAEDLDGDVTYNTVKYKKMNAYNPNLGDDYCGEWKTFTYNNVELTTDGYYLIGLYGRQYAMFDYIKFTANTGVFCPNTITMAKSGDDGAAAPTASPANTAMAGTKVTVTAEAASANHYFSGWTVSPENAVTFDDPSSPTTTFEMPAEDVTITANYGEVVSSALTFVHGEGGSIVSATAGGNAISSGAEVISGTSVTLTAGANTNYVFINWTDDNGAEVSTNAAFTFSMPATATAYTANFAQVDNKIITGTSAKVIESNGTATLTVTSVSDFDAFNHNVLKFAYSDMEGKYKGQKVAIDEGYSSASSAGATGFGFYYKTEKADDHVAFCFEVSSGQQVKWELQATNNVWKYYYFAHPEAADWDHSGIYIYMNGDDGGNHTAYKDGGAFYISEIAATSITYKPDIDTYTYTRELSADYGTLCLPMAGTIEGATLYSVAGKQEEGGKLYIVLEEQGATLAAGEPYIFETDGPTLTATMNGPQSAVKAEANGLVGTYQQITAPAYSEPDDLNYVLALDNSNNTVFKRVGADVTVGAYRAYINIENVVDYSPASAAPGRKYIRFGIEGTEEEQAVEMIYDEASLRTRKIMQNGHLYILRDGHLFTAQGTQIK